ncbi:caspase family protein [Pseudodesulfovibrio sp. zrk46]|uniref:caspase family protein n=1 Tax=Pseudodesulfovibrio sp. zrk46 TaxID=2725288 RepID=UPI001448CECD|nr:caspase family protein [Pseudodesulfovibrio sp. zrk46]QJB57053.1 DUF4384 domain-containing protein [Pseudodesulfovibrio sp. zrk46]
MRLATILLLLAIIFVSVTEAHSANRALLIGVGDYQMKGANLPGIDKDIKMMREVALTLGYQKSEIKVLLDKQATLKNIRHAIDSWLIKGVGKDDNVLFYFSGHGSQIYDKNKDEPDKADEVLVTHDASIGVNTLNNVFVDDMFNEMLEKIPSKNVFILIDACHSGTATRSIPGQKGLYPKYIEYPGMPRTTRSVSFASKSIQGLQAGTYSALSAAQDNQRAQASNLGSFFTLGIRDAIVKASKGRRSITMLSLHDKTTAYIAKQLPDPGLVHRPALVGGADNNQKNMFVSKKPRPQKPQKPPKKQSWSEELKELVDSAAYTVSATTNARSFKVGDSLVITSKIAKGGYVNIVTLQPGDNVPTVLYPNKYHVNNWIGAGQTVTIPAPGDRFVLKAAPPSGKALIAVFVSPNKVNMYEQGYGEGVFKMMSKSSTRGFVVESAPEPEAPEPPKPKPRKYGAGIVYVTIK